MEKFILKNKNGRPVFIQQPGNLKNPPVRLIPETYMKVNMLAEVAGITLGQVIQQCVDYAFNNMAAVDPKEEEAQ